MTAEGNPGTKVKKGTVQDGGCISVPPAERLLLGLREGSINVDIRRPFVLVKRHCFSFAQDPTLFWLILHDCSTLYYSSN